MLLDSTKPTYKQACWEMAMLLGDQIIVLQDPARGDLIMAQTAMHDILLRAILPPNMTADELETILIANGNPGCLKLESVKVENMPNLDWGHPYGPLPAALKDCINPAYRNYVVHWMIFFHDNHTPHSHEDTTP